MQRRALVSHPAASDRASVSSIAWPSLELPVAALAGLAAVVLTVFLVRLSLGTVSVPIGSVIGALFGLESPIPTSIVVGYRLPRALAAMLAGAAMAVSGLQMQTLLRNPLAGPWLLGVVGCARLGVAVLLTLGPLLGIALATTFGPLASSALAIAAIAGAALGMGAVAWLSRRITPVTLLLAGVILTYVADSAARVLILVAPPSQKSIFIAWNDGSFDNITWPQLQIFLVIGVVALVASIGLVKVLDALVLGDRYAGSLGHSLRRARAFAILGIVVLAGSATAFCGPLAFLDVAVPHLARTLFRTVSHRVLIPATALLGALLGLAADLTTSLPGAQQVLHINHTTAIIGGPVILWVLLRSRTEREMPSS
jgi:iron complex transport system permease protein